MNTKERLYAVIGGCVGAVLTMVVCSFLPLGAQSQGDSYGEITCTGLKVIDSEGRVAIRLSNSDYPSVASGVIQVFGKDDSNAFQAVWIGVSEKNGMVGVYNRDFASAQLKTNENGGCVTVFGTRESKFEEFATMQVADQGGSMVVHNRQGKTVGGLGVYESRGMVTVLGEGGTELGLDTGVATMRVDEEGGNITVHRRKSTGEGVRIDTNQYGGKVIVFGKGNKLSRAIMGVDEYGNGGVSTWDKNGYRR